MRVAFYAPMKPPDHPVPSGDRRMGRLLIEALRRAGHEVELACRYVSREGGGDPLRQARLQAVGEKLAASLVKRYARKREERRPKLWFTYHLYYKAPDYIGPLVASGLGIPYLAAEASLAHKRAGGPWDLGHRAVLAALAQAKGVVTFNPDDAEGLDPALRQLELPPFLDAAPYLEARARRREHRSALAKTYGLDTGVPWLLTVAMLRPDAKLASYRLLASLTPGSAPDGSLGPAARLRKPCLPSTPPPTFSSGRRCAKPTAWRCWRRRRRGCRWWPGAGRASPWSCARGRAAS
jgi:hypothetical protein